MFKLQGRIKECRVALLNWNRSINNTVLKQIKELKDNIEKVKKTNREDQRCQLDRLHKDLSEAYRKEEIFLAKRLGADGSRKVTKTPLFSMPVLLGGGEVIPYQFYKRKMVISVLRRRMLKRRS